MNLKTTFLTLIFTLLNFFTWGQCIGFGTQSTTSPNKDDMHFVYACNSSNILLSDGLTVVGGTAPYSYLWQNVSNETITNSTSFNATLSGVPTTGYLHLRVTDANGCISWDSVFVEQDPNCISTGMQQILPSKQLKIVQVYPNPTEENTTLTLSLIESMEITVTTHTLSGQLVSKHKHTLTSGTSTIQLATKELPQGIYLIAVSNNEEITTNFKLIKK